MGNRPAQRASNGKALRKPAAPFRARLVIMAKVPIAGQVKTRLTRRIGVAEAVRFYRATARAVVGRLGGQPFWETVIAVSPDTGISAHVWPRGVTLARQGRGDLGARMQRPMRALGPGPVCVVGTDVPGIEVEHIRRAFRLLGNCDAVFGPAADGGFWLVGMRRRPRVMNPYSNGVRWSHAETLADVRRNLEGHAVGLTERLNDVDEAEDLARQLGQFGRRIRPHPH